MGMPRTGKIKISFTLYDEDAELARQFQAAAGMGLTQIAELALMRYIYETVARAEDLEKQQGQSALINGAPSEH